MVPVIEDISQDEELNAHVPLNREIQNEEIAVDDKKLQLPISLDVDFDRNEELLEEFAVQCTWCSFLIDLLGFK